MSHSNENRCCGDTEAAGLLLCYLTCQHWPINRFFCFKKNRCHDINTPDKYNAEQRKKNMYHIFVLSMPSCDGSLNAPTAFNQSGDDAAACQFLILTLIGVNLMVTVRLTFLIWETGGKRQHFYQCLLITGCSLIRRSVVHFPCQILLWYGPMISTITES